MTGSDDDGDSAAGPACSCKVGRVADRYSLPGLPGELRARWTEDGDERESLRDLAAAFNRRLLESAMVDAGMNPLAGEVENVYDLLAGEANPGDRVQAENRLAHADVPVDRLRSDFVTHQTVYRHLTNCLDATYEGTPDAESRLERDVERIEGFQRRITGIVDDAVKRLQRADLLAVERPRTYVDVRITCEDCGVQLTPGELLTRDACACSDEGT